MIIEIKVQTNSGKQEIDKISDNKYKVFLKSSPENNKANVELIKFLSKYIKKNPNFFGVTKFGAAHSRRQQKNFVDFGKQVKIKAGFNSKRKFIEIFDENPE